MALMSSAPRRMGNPQLLLLVVFLCVGPAHAEDETQFGFDLFSDIAPILALFGEQFARQFMTLVPLGILTIITGAIRVSGPQVAKSFIGRARENRALVEIELMSSTSQEVCEVFNGRSIVRALGKPMIAGFLIFPDEYNLLEDAYDELDTAWRDSKGSETLEPHTNNSCGIHSLETAKVTKGVYGQQLMEYGAQRFERAAPPNLQLNLSSDHFSASRTRKRHGLFLAAITAVFLQASLIAIAAISVYHVPTRDALSSVHKPWGLPCYVTGSVLLSIGIGICSTCVEHSTTEKVYKVPGKWSPGHTTSGELDSCPRLLWLQQNQTVNDQEFRGYTILTGPKRRVLYNATTSSLWKALTLIGVTASGVGFIAQFVGLRGLAFPCSIAQLLAILVMALIRAGIRRRLGRIPAHCAVISKKFYRQPSQNQLYTGKAPADQLYRWAISAPEGFHDHEPFYFIHPGDTLNNPEDDAAIGERRGPGEAAMSFESLAGSAASTFAILPTETSNNKKGPRFERASSQQLLRVRERLGNLCRWSSQASETALFLVQSVELFMEIFFPRVSKGGNSQLNTFDWVISTDNPSWSDSASVEQPDFIVIPVQRSTNGKWAADAGKVEAALSLLMAAIEAKSMKERDGIDRQPERARAAGFGASWEPDWRRIKTTSGTNLAFYRILGTNFEDGVLKRDLSWWVDELAFAPDRSEFTEGTAEVIKFVIGYSGRPGAVDSRRRDGDDEFEELGVVSSPPLSTILAQHLFTNFMWNIARRLPNNCLRSGYTTSQQGVEIEARDSFSPSEFSTTWFRPKLRHRHLAKIARQMNTNGLGTIAQILYCMILALSFHDLFPNHVILKLMPRLLESGLRVSNGEGERFFYAVMVAAMYFLYLACEPYTEFHPPPSGLDVEIRGLVEKLTSKKFIASIKMIAPIYDVQNRLGAFETIFKRHKPAERPNSVLRSTSPHEGVELYKSFFKDSLGFSDRHCRICTQTATPANAAVFFTVLGDANARFESMGSLIRYGPKSPDIFGWAPIHYGFLTQEVWVAHDIIANIQRSREVVRIHKLEDNIGRSPIHALASAGPLPILRTAVDTLRDEEKNIALRSVGLDGMTPFHLAVTSGDNAKLDYVIGLARHSRTMTETDVWGREAIHIAASMENLGITGTLLSNGSGIEQFDDIGKSPVDYLLIRKLDNDEGRHSDIDTSPEPLSHHSNPENTGEGQEHILDNDRCMILKEFAFSRPDYRDVTGKTFLHIAAQFAGVDTIETLLKSEKFTPIGVDHPDAQRRTPLHWAILAGNSAVALELIDKFGSNPSAKDINGTSVLMFAASENQQSVVEELFLKAEQAKSQKENNSMKEEDEKAINKKDDERILAACELTDRDLAGRSALHYAVGHDMSPGMPDETRVKTVEFLIDKGYDPTATDTGGRTVLHSAIEQNNEAIVLFLLRLERGQVLPEPEGVTTDTLLVLACKSHCTAAIPHILKRWPEMINEGDRSYGQPPISWACEKRFKDIVHMLLTQVPGIDVNKPARGWRGYTPLHFTVGAGDDEILAWLLEKEDADAGAKNEYYETPVTMAIERGYPLCALQLLLHPKTSDRERVAYLDTLSSQPHEGFQTVTGKVLEIVKDESMSDEQLHRLLESTDTMEEPKSGFETLMDRFLKRRIWNQVKDPYHRAAKVGSLEIVAGLTEAGGDPAALDEDRWSCLDLASRLEHSPDFFNALKEHVEEHGHPNHAENSHDPHLKPTTFQLPVYLQEILRLSPNLVRKQAEYTEIEGYASEATIPSPLQPQTGSILFRGHGSQRLKLQSSGHWFCGSDTGEDEMPGWFKGSWAYHADDGQIFIESGQHIRTVSRDFGPRGQFGAGDTAGVYLNLNTGEAFYTLNGKKLDMGPSFVLKNLTRGKVYPCVGVDTTQAGKDFVASVLKSMNTRRGRLDDRLLAMDLEAGIETEY
ncbi:Ankyrin repeat-containing domain protein [Rhypophila decipiens]